MPPAGIPVVLGLSWVLLGKRPSAVAAAGALLILLGTVVRCQSWLTAAIPTEKATATVG
jgi:hypothetical protein